MQIGYVDVRHSEVEKYLADVEKKRGTCRVLPAARFSIRTDGVIQYNGLVCHPMDMGGDATGVGAIGCDNCVRQGK